MITIIIMIMKNYSNNSNNKSFSNDNSDRSYGWSYVLLI